MKTPTELWFIINDWTVRFFWEAPKAEEQAKAQCAGRVFQTSGNNWVAEPHLAWKDALFLYDNKEEQQNGHTLLQFRLRKYVKDRKIRVAVRKTPFEPVLWWYHKNPCFNEAGPKSAETRSCFMRSLSELHKSKPDLFKTLEEHDNWSGYSREVIEAAKQGSTTYKPNPIYHTPLPDFLQ